MTEPGIVRLPAEGRLPDHEGATPAGEHEINESVQRGPCVDRVRVLIVDDSPQARDGLRSILGSQPDIEVAAVAASGLEAAALAEDLQPDLALVDAQVPEMDGEEVTRSIKHCCPLVKVLFMTVHDRHIDEGIAAGADRCLMKDCTRQELLRAVRELAAKADATT